MLREQHPGPHHQKRNIQGHGEFVDVSWHFMHMVPFDRIRRITGYLVGSLDRFNNAKRAEVLDRVEHSVNGY